MIVRHCEGCGKVDLTRRWASFEAALRETETSWSCPECGGQQFSLEETERES